MSDAARAAKFLANVVKNESGCWVWSGRPNSSGYGRFTFNKAADTAHRWAYRLFKGEDPGALYVCHSCDNKMCVNPEHLWLGTLQDNIRDMVKKGRQAKGARRHNARLDDVRARAVKELHKIGVPQNEIAAFFGIHKATINDVATGKTWRHV